MAELFPLYRTGPQVQSLRQRFEKAGVIVEDQPIPWGADAVLIEVCVFLPPTLASRSPTDYPLRLGEDATVYAPESLNPLPRGGVKLLYRLPVPKQTTLAEVFFRNRSLAQLSLPVLAPAEFTRRLTIEMPTLAAHLGDLTVACQAFVGGQCHGLVTSAVLKSPTSLLPLMDLGMSVLLAGPRGESRVVPLAFSSSSLSGRQMLASAVLPRPSRLGEWQVSWRLGNQVINRQTLRALSKPQFLRSLRLAGTRFVVQKGDAVSLLAALPERTDRSQRIGPCFLVESAIPAVAGRVRLRVLARARGAVAPPLLEEEDLLIGDGPNPLAPGTISAADLEHIEAFEIHAPRGLLGRLPLRIPAAAIDAEGGFRAAEDFAWSDAAEEELRLKLAALTKK